MSLDIIQIEKKLSRHRFAFLQNVTGLDAGSSRHLNKNARLEAYIWNLLIHSLLKQGKLHIAQKIVSKIAFFVKFNEKRSSLNFLYQAVRNVRPLLGLKNQTSLKRNQKPQVIPLSSRTSYQLAIRWLIEGAKQRTERTMALRLFHELVDAYAKKGYAIKKKYEWHSRPLATQLKSYSFKKSNQKARGA